jgi:hypothetical protein
MVVVVVVQAVGPSRVLLLVVGLVGVQPVLLVLLVAPQVTAGAGSRMLQAAEHGQGGSWRRLGQLPGRSDMQPCAAKDGQEGGRAVVRICCVAITPLRDEDDPA